MWIGHKFGFEVTVPAPDVAFLRAVKGHAKDNVEKEL